MAGRKSAEEFTLVRMLPDGMAEFRSERGRAIRGHLLKCQKCNKTRPEWGFRGQKCESCVAADIVAARAAREKRMAEWRTKWEADGANRKFVLGRLASRRRFARIKQATPAWVDMAQIYEIYDECERITFETGIQHHVDHIWPIFHTHCCGLHVPWNLRVVPARENLKKSWNLPKVVDETKTNQYISASFEKCV